MLFCFQSCHLHDSYVVKTYSLYHLGSSKPPRQKFSELSPSLLGGEFFQQTVQISRSYKNHVFEEIAHKDENEYCKLICGLIPITETESWLFADKNLLKRVIGTEKSDSDLNITGNPETFTDPKTRIAEAIRIGRSEYPKKIRNQLSIADLYSPIGESLDINTLNNFESYNKFRENIKEIFKNLNLL